MVVDPLEVEGKFVEGVWLPPQEEHLVEWMTTGKKAHRHRGRITYQWWKQEAAHNVAEAHGYLGRDMIDIGAHCALWSMWWAEWMHRVFAFEPIPQYQELYMANMRLEGHENYSLFNYALSDEHGALDLRVDPSNTGGTRAYAKGEVHDVGVIRAPMEPLDSVLLPCADSMNVGVIKIDCEGYEEKVLRGGAQIIEKFRPMIVVEQKFENKHFGFERRGAVHLLERWGYKSVKEISGDHIMVPA